MDGAANLNDSSLAGFRQGGGSRRLAFAGLGLVSLLAVAVTFFAVTTGGSEKWTEYTNAEHGYQFSYPRSWSTDVQDAGTTQYGPSQVVTVSHGEDSVLFGTNLDTSWCASVDDFDLNQIDVAGVAGEEYRCYVGADRRLVTIVRNFEDSTGEGESYTVIGQAGKDPDNVVRIVESFQFTTP